MSLPSLSAVNNEWWESVCKYAKEAVVFIDDKACECLHWNGGLTRLYTLDTIDVVLFSVNNKIVFNDAKKVVFVLSSPLYGNPLRKLKHILDVNSSFEQCVVLTAAHPSVHVTVYQDFITDEDKNTIIKDLQRQLLSHMNDKIAPKVEIIYHPIFMAPITTILFVTPTFDYFFPFLPVDLETFDFGDTAMFLNLKGEKPLPEKLSDLEFSNLPVNVQIPLQMFAYCFNSFLEKLNVKEDYFSIGHLSRIITSVLDGLPSVRSRRKTAQAKASVLFVDCTLDVVSPTSHGIDTLMDRILNILPRFPGHKNDVAIDMHPVCSAKSCNKNYARVILPGCLVQNYQSSGSSTLNSLVFTKHKECLMDLNRTLVDVITKEKLTTALPNKPGRLSTETIENHIKSFRNVPEILHSHIGLIQLALAVVEALHHPYNSHIDQLYGIEKGFLQSMGESNVGESTLNQFCQLLKCRKERSIDTDDIMILLLNIYSLAGNKIFEWKTEEEELQEELNKAILEDTECLSEDVKTFIGECIDEYTVPAAVKEFFQRLNDIATIRDSMKKYKFVYEPGSKAQPATYNSLMRQMLQDILHPSRPDLQDIEYKSAGLKDKIKSGFSYFLNVNKPRPCDNSILIIYVLGGISSTEVRQIRETIINQRPDIQVLIGSTQLTTPKDKLHQILNPLHKAFTY